MFSHGCGAEVRAIGNSRVRKKKIKKDARLLKFKVRRGNMHQELRGSPL